MRMGVQIMTTPLAGPVYDLGSPGHSSQPTRRVFFSFHCKPDRWCTNIVRHSSVAKRHHGGQEGYVDSSILEKAKTEGGASIKRLIKRLIDQGLSGCSVTCILIGKNTFERPWVQYEIFKSIGDGKGVFGVFLGGLRNSSGCTDIRGTNPFQCLGYRILDAYPGKLVPCVHYSSGWEIYTDADPILSSASCVEPFINSGTLSERLSVYDWVCDRGYDNFSSWVQTAAQQAQR